MALTEPPPEVAAGAVTVIVERDAVAEPDHWAAAVAELEAAACAALERALGRKPAGTRRRIGVLYGCLSPSGATFRPFPCPEATHARVTVRLVEETR